MDGADGKERVMPTNWHVEWTDTQWDMWETQSTTIELSKLEALVDATELLAEGRRLNEAERRHWSDVANDMRARIGIHVAIIDDLGK